MPRLTARCVRTTATASSMRARSSGARSSMSPLIRLMSSPDLGGSPARRAGRGCVRPARRRRWRRRAVPGCGAGRRGRRSGRAGRRRRCGSGRSRRSGTAAGSRCRRRRRWTARCRCRRGRRPSRRRSRACSASSSARACAPDAVAVPVELHGGDLVDGVAAAFLADAVVACG